MSQPTRAAGGGKSSTDEHTHCPQCAAYRRHLKRRRRSSALLVAGSVIVALAPHIGRWLLELVSLLLDRLLTTRGG